MKLHANCIHRCYPELTEVKENERLVTEHLSHPDVSHFDATTCEVSDHVHSFISRQSLDILKLCLLAVCMMLRPSIGVQIGGRLVGVKRARHPMKYVSLELTLGIQLSMGALAYMDCSSHHFEDYICSIYWWTSLQTILSPWWLYYSNRLINHFHETCDV